MMFKSRVLQLTMSSGVLVKMRMVALMRWRLLGSTRIVSRSVGCHQWCIGTVDRLSVRIILTSWWALLRRGIIS